MRKFIWASKAARTWYGGCGKFCTRNHVRRLLTVKAYAV